MILGKRVAVVLPAYNAAKTLERTFLEIPTDVVDDVILTDDASIDATEKIARSLGFSPSSMSAIAAMAATRRPVTPPPLSEGPTS